jgi:hypothetical protein
MKFFKFGWTALRPFPWRHPRQWPNWIICTVGDGPLVLLPAGWRQRLREPWKIVFVGIVDILSVVLPWCGLVLRLRRPPERLMTAMEKYEGGLIMSSRRATEKIMPSAVRLRDRWECAWVRAQRRAHERALARGDREGF